MLNTEERDWWIRQFLPFAGAYYSLTNLTKQVAICIEYFYMSGTVWNVEDITDRKSKVVPADGKSRRKHINQIEKIKSKVTDKTL